MTLMTQVLSHWSRTFRLGYAGRLTNLRLYLSQLPQLDAKILFMCLLDTLYTTLLMCLFIFLTILHFWNDYNLNI